MEIRYAKETDDFKQIAKLVYETDRYIYPYWFASKEEGICVLEDILKRPNSSYYYKNCIVAVVDGKIVGVLLYFTDKSPIDYDYSDLTCKNFNYNHTITNYVVEVEKEIQKNSAYVVGIRVDENYTRRHIAENMFEYFFKQLQKGSKVLLDVLVENAPAFALYKKIGFEITSEYKGYNGYRMKKPLCYSMEKKI